MSNTPDEVYPGLGEDIQEAENYLFNADTKLEAVAERIESIIDETQDPDIDVQYDLDEVTIDVNVSFTRSVRRLNEHLSPPLMARETDRGIDIVNLKKRYEAYDMDSYDGPLPIKTLIEIFEDSQAESYPGADIESVKSFASDLGYTTIEIEGRIENLKKRGEVYEPRTGYLCTT